MSSVELARIAGPVAAAGLALLLVSGRRDLRLAGVAVWAIGGLAFAPLLAPSGHRALLGAAAVFGLAAVCGFAWLLARWPWLLALGALAAVPARVPVHVGSTEANLLIPMYGIVAGAAVLLAWQLWHGDVRERELGPLAIPLALIGVWFGLSLAWTDDVREGSIEMVFFVLPFGLLALALARLEWTRSTVRLVYALLGGLALVFAAVGLFQWATHEVFWNNKVRIGNAFHSEFFFRVNSLFWDPSIYGRFLVVAILATLVPVVYGLRGERLAAAIAGIAFVWLGLLVSFSQSSFAALVAGTLIVAVFVWRRRALAVVAVTAVVAVVVALAIPTTRHSFSKGLNHATSGRWGQVTTGLHIARDHPLAGVGLGDFKRAYAERTGVRGKEPKAGASHNTAVTVAAETGIVGLTLFAWLLVSGLLAAFRVAGPRFGGQVALVTGATLAALGVHSLFYNAFFEDPTTWGLFALAAVVWRPGWVEARDAACAVDGVSGTQPVATTTPALAVPPEAEGQ